MVLTTSAGVIPPFFLLQNSAKFFKIASLFSPFQNGFLSREISNCVAKHHVMNQGLPKFLAGLAAISK